MCARHRNPAQATRKPATRQTSGQASGPLVERRKQLDHPPDIVLQARSGIMLNVHVSSGDNGINQKLGLR
jgi:hypothetical protein